MPRAVIFAYGVFAYVLFLAVFAYLAGFLLDILVPKAINDPMPGSQTFASGEGVGASLEFHALLINLGVIALFGVTHSVMARGWFKRRLTKIIPPAAERSTYVLQSSLCLALAMWQWRAMDTTVWQIDGQAQFFFYALFLLGTVILLLSTFLIDHFELFGLRQIWSNLSGKPMPAPKFRTPMLYTIVRHPMQLGIIILLFAAPHMTVGHLLLAASMTAYIFVGLYFEERGLLKTFGERYAAYQTAVPMLFPRVWPRAAHRLVGPSETHLGKTGPT